LKKSTTHLKQKKQEEKKEEDTQTTGITWITFGAGTGPFPHKKTLYSVPLEVLEKMQQNQNSKQKKQDKNI